MEDKKQKEWEVEKILGERNKDIKSSKKKGKRIKREFLIKWKGFKKATWEPEKNLENCQELLKEYFIEKRREKELKKSIRSRCFAFKYSPKKLKSKRKDFHFYIEKTFSSNNTSVKIINDPFPKSDNSLMSNNWNAPPPQNGFDYELFEISTRNRRFQNNNIIDYEILDDNINRHKNPTENSKEPLIFSNQILSLSDRNDLENKEMLFDNINILIN